MKKRFLIAAILVMAVVACKNPVSAPDDKPIPPQNKSTLVFEGSNNLITPLTDGWMKESDVVGFQIMMGDGTDFCFQIPSGGRRVFTGDSTNMFAGKWARIGSGLRVVRGDDHKQLSCTPPGKNITLPDSGVIRVDFIIEATD